MTTLDEAHLVDIPMDESLIIDDPKPRFNCAVCLDDSLENTDAYYKIHTCTDAVLCEKCITEFTNRNIHKCPVCRQGLDISKIEKHSISPHGKVLLSLIAVVVVKLVIEVCLTTVILSAKDSVGITSTNGFFILFLLSNIMTNYSGVFFIVVAIGKYHTTTLPQYTKILTCLLFYHAIVLAIMSNVSSLQEDAFKSYLVYFIAPIYGTMYAVSILLAIWSALRNCKYLCFDACTEKKIKTFRINPIEVLQLNPTESNIS